MIHGLWHLRGSVPLSASCGDADALDAIDRLLDAQGKAVTHRDATGIRFAERLLHGGFGPNWRAMVVYEQGVFRIERDAGGGRLRYDLRSLHGFVFSLVAATLFGTFALVEGASFAMCIALLAFAWLYGGNMVLARLRVPSAIRRALAQR